jgi:hypothetical protein
MKRLALLLLLSVAALLAGPALWAQRLQPRLRAVAGPPARKAQLRLYLLVGQSNMAGRGAVEAQDTVPNPRVLRLNQAGQWEIAQDPVHFDKSVAGVGPGLSFGQALAAQAPGQTIGLIPCAVGGSGMAFWQPGAYFPDTRTHPYDDALARARRAMQSGTLAGIIWHQGESDSSPEKSSAYQQQLADLIQRLRRDLQTPNVPFVAGQLPAFQFEQGDGTGPRRVNQAVAALAQTVPHYAYVTAEGTHDVGDHTHVDAASARLMGQRYARAMQTLQRSAKPGKRR